MLLMDSVIQAGQWAVETGAVRHPTLTLYPDLAERLAPPKGPHPPRYVFDQNAIRTATELTLGRPKVYREVMRRMRVPYPAMWVEWEDIGRAKLRDIFTQPPELAAIRPYPQRMGFLIEAGDGYRCGKITWAWTQTDHKSEIFGMLSPAERKFMDNMPNVSAITAHFDLDGDFPIDFIEKYPLTLAEIWKDNPVQKDAFYSIWRTVEHRANKTAVDALVGDRERERALLYADVVGEYIMVWACLMLLTTARDSVDLRTVDLSKLNKARQKSQKAALLNHNTVHLHLRPHSPEVIRRGPLDFRRKSPHIHMVSHYLSRGGKIVEPYVRGSGLPPAGRSIRVHG